MTTLTRFSDAQRPFTAIVAGVPADGWTRPSPCAGWTARDVLAHVVDTERDFLARHGVDLGPRPDGDPAAGWSAHVDRVTAAIAHEALTATAFDGFFGPTTVGATFEQFYVWDLLVHRWDLSQAVGADAGLTDAELDLVDTGADGFGAALHADGICAPALELPAGADRTTRVLARLGRRP